MKTRKLISTILALLLALQLIVPAFASEEIFPPETGETVEEILPPGILEEVLPGTPPEEPVPQEPADTQTPDDTITPEEVPDAVQEPNAEPNPDNAQRPDAADELREPSETDAVPPEDLIDVLVPSTGEMFVNPYCLATSLDEGETTAQIVHAPQALVNLSDFPVTVNVVASGTLTLESKVVFVPTPPTLDAPDKEVFLYAEFSSQYDWWEGDYCGLSNQVPISESGTIGENVLTLEAGGEGYFRLFGEMSPFPKEMWSDTDGFGVVLAFTFAPLYPELEPVENAETPETPEETPPVEPEAPVMPEETPPTEPETPETPEETPPTESETPETSEETPPTEPETSETPEETSPMAEEIPPEGDLPAEEIFSSEEDISAPADMGVNYG